MKKSLMMLSILTVILMLVACNQSTSNEGSNEDNESGSNEEIATTDFPKKPIELIVPFPAGGSTDMAARVIAEGASKYMPNNQPIVIVNRPGGAMTVALTEVNNANPDGYKLAFTPISGMSIQPHYGEAQYSHDSFQPIMQATSGLHLLVVSAKSDWQNFEEWIAYVRENPGVVDYATPGSGTTAHIAMEGLNLMAGIETVHVPFGGSADATNATLGGHVDAMAVVVDDLDRSQLRPIANFGGVTNEEYSDVPVLADFGIDLEIGVTNGIIAPNGLPAEVLEILHEAFKKALEDEEVSNRLENINQIPAYLSPEDYQANISNQYELNKDILKYMGIID